MDRSTSPRPRRVGAVSSSIVVALISLLAWEAIGRWTSLAPVTPVRFLEASWAVAKGEIPKTVQPPSVEELRLYAYRPLPYVMFGLKPKWRRQGQTDSRGNVLLKTSNTRGFRGKDFEVPKPPGRYRIVCLGCSVTYGDSVSDFETYPVQLERELRKARPDLDVEVVNAGVPSYTSAETLANFAFQCLDWEPDAVLVYEGINDLRPRQYCNFDSAYSHYRKIWDGTTASWAKGEGDVGGGINALIQHPFPKDNGDPAENMRRAGSAAFRRNLTSLSGIARAHGVKVIFVTQAWDPSNAYLEKHVISGLEEHNGIVRDVAVSRGDFLVDLVREFAAERQFVDPVHMNAEGYAQMARIIAAGLCKYLF